MRDGFYQVKIHGTQTIYLHEDEKFFIPDFDKKKKKWVWTQTVIDPERAKTIRQQLSLIEIVDSLNKYEIKQKVNK